MKVGSALFCLTLVVGPVGNARAQSASEPPEPPNMPHYKIVNKTVTLHELSPVAYFRVLLGMTPGQREKALAEKSPAQRDAILHKVTEYEALPAPIREARLRQTELRWMLTGLMKTPVAKRESLLEGVAEPDRTWLTVRLQQWDKLPAEEQKAYLEKESFLSLYLRWQAASSVDQADIINKLPVDRRAQWTNELGRWQALPASERQSMSERFTQFFAMDDRQQQATVSTLSDEERRQMEVSLMAFARLPVDKRQQCVRSFGKFAMMNADEQGEFLRNAARWEAMTPAERRLWRQLVQSLPALPPMPPGFRLTPRGALPPMPPGFPSGSAPKNTYAKSGTN